MSVYTGHKTLYNYLSIHIPDGVHSLDVNGEMIDIELYNFYENITYSTTPILGDDIPDTKMLILKYHKNLTIHSDVVVTPQVRKKGMAILVNGTLINNGTISMTARGAVAEGQNVYLYQNNDGSFEYVPAVGANGGNAVYASTSVQSVKGINGNAGNFRDTGGGGSGANKNGSSGGYGWSGAGASGTSYSGGSGGGSRGGTVSNTNAQSGSQNGGSGGDGYSKASTGWSYSGGGGAGNPSGKTFLVNSSYIVESAQNGTGGLLIVYSNNFINSGTVESKGSRGASCGATSNNITSGGGGSGGGSINIFTTNLENSGDINASGGSGGSASLHGGNGGDGSVTVSEINTHKYLVKTSSGIKTIDNIDELKDIDSIEPLAKIDFEMHGFTNLQSLLDTKSKKNILMTYKGDLEDGKIYTLNIDRTEYPIIEKVQIMNN